MIFNCKSVRFILYSGDQFKSFTISVNSNFFIIIVQSSCIMTVIYLYQIKRTAELVATEIPKNCDLLRKSVPGHLKGTAIAVLVSDELSDAASQMAALYPFMKQLVTSGSYDITNADGKTEKHKVNLLNSAERYYIANEVVGKGA